MGVYIGTSLAAGDGNVFNDNAGTWATVKGLTSGTAQPTADPVSVYASKLISSSIGRIFLPFDTTSIPTGATVESVKLTFNVTDVLSSNGTIHVVQSTQAAPDNLVNNDFDNLLFVSGGSVAITTTGSKDINFNATGLAFVTKGGFTLLALIEEHDQTNSDPDPDDFRFSVNMSENATPESRPTLTVTYSGGADDRAYYM
jgi:hypothetical protein